MIRQAVFFLGEGPPRALVEVAPGLRFLDFVLEEAARHGFEDILLLAAPSSEALAAAYDGRRVREARVSVARTPEPLGAGGGLSFMAERLAPWFLLGRGDVLFEINLRALTMGCDDRFAARLALREGADAAAYGGLAVIRRDGVLPFIEGPCSIEEDVLPKLAGAGLLESRRFDGYFLDLAAPGALARAQAEVAARRLRPAAFLDRDGVLNVDRGYTHKPEDLAFITGAPEAVRMLNEAGFYVIVVTNQAGVARGLYPEAQIGVFHAAMAEALAAEGAHVDAFYHCPFHENATVPAYRVANHPDRKPNPGMIVRAMQDWPVRRRGSFLIGDRESDLAAAKAAGLPGFLFAGEDLRRAVEGALLSA